MRVLTFLHSFEPGGVERVALRLVREWRQSGQDAPLFMGRNDGALRAELAEELEYDVPSPRWWTAGLETLWMIVTLPGVIRDYDPDVLFCAGNTYTVVVMAMKLLLGRRCPPVVSKVSNELLRPGHGPLMCRLYRGWGWLQSKFVDTWVVMHPTMRAQVRGLCPSREIAVVPDPALTLDKWRPCALGDHEMALKAVEGLSPWGDLFRKKTIR